MAISGVGGHNHHGRDGKKDDGHQFSRGRGCNGFISGEQVFFVMAIVSVGGGATIMDRVERRTMAANFVERGGNVCLRTRLVIFVLILALVLGVVKTMTPPILMMLLIVLVLMAVVPGIPPSEPQWAAKAEQTATQPIVVVILYSYLYSRSYM
jgi:hypothetical protein